MNWTTLYITGRADFREEVRRKMENSKLDCMPGYIDSSTGRGFYDLYWLNETTTLREVKEVIGSKLIWKYRLRLFPTLESFIESRNNQTQSVTLTKEDLSLLDALRKSA